MKKQKSESEKGVTKANKLFPKGSKLTFGELARWVGIWMLGGVITGLVYFLITLWVSGDIAEATDSLWQEGLAFVLISMFTAIFIVGVFKERAD